jgi:hypothetical protein
MVINLDERRAEKERAKLERNANPSFARDLFETAALYVTVMCALGVVVWVVLANPGK